GNDMKRSTTQAVLVALLVTLTTVTMSPGPNAFAQRRSDGVNQFQVDRLLGRISMRWNQFRRSLDSDFSRTRVSNNMSSQMTAFEDSIARFRERSRQRNEGAEEVRDLLTQAGGINGYVRSRRMGGPVTDQWTLLRTDLDSLARYYNVTWQWDDRTSQVGWGNPGGGNRDENRLRGTYRLDASRSQNVAEVIRREARGLPVQQQERIARRMDSPEVMAIERQG